MASSKNRSASVRDVLAPQARGVLVDLVVELLGRGEDARARLLADRRDCRCSARETVGCDTPASAAMSNEVGRLCVSSSYANDYVLNTYV